jgi:rhodanese-related sulfurtransferase
MRKRIVGLALGILIATAAAEDAVIQPKDLAAQLQAKGAKPAIFYVGFAVMYKKHIPGAITMGPTSRTQGLEGLRAAVAGLPRDREVVLYCGCCPWDQCPNMNPALSLLKQMGFTRVKALMIPTNFAADWVDHGYPTELAGAATK